MSKKSGMMPTAAPVDPSHDEYEVKNHLETLMKAHEIQSDPEKMKKVHKLAGRHKKAITSIRQIKDRYADMVKPKANAMVPDDDNDDE